MPPQKNQIILICLFLSITTLIAFWQLKDNDFVNYDDYKYIVDNPHVKEGFDASTVAWAFTNYHVGHWHPLTWLSFILDYKLYGLNPSGYHLTNLFLHVINTLLLFLLFTGMTQAVWQSAAVAALFAIHPLHVESVAWVVERKDVLSTLFFILAMISYAGYVKRQKVQLYIVTLLLFIFGLMCKPMLVTLPFVLLLLDYWPLRRFKLGSSDEAAQSAELTSGKQSSKKKKTKRQTVEVAPHYSSLPHLVKEKIPFFILSALSSLITVLAAQGAGAASGLEALPLGTRISNAVVSYVIYMWKMIWPQNLAVFYPHPGMLPVWEVLGALLVLALITYLVVRAANKFPYLPVGWLWYLGTMVPVIGIVQAGAQAMADRYTYIPLIGVFVMIVWGLPELAKTWRHQRIMLGILAGFIITMMVIGSWLQVRYWHESVTLFQHALDVTPQNATAHNNLGTAFREKGDMDKAIFHYMEAARIDPKDPKPYYNIGEVLAQRGEIKGAIPYFQKALDIKPDFLKARYNLGLAFMQMGDLEQASQHFRETIRIMPADKEANLNMGVIQARRGNYDEAISYFYRVLQTRPDYAEAHKNLGIALMQKGYLYEAISRLQEALRILPSDPEIPYILGRVFAKQGNLDKAAMYLTKSLEIKPDNADAHNSLGATLARQGKLHEAISHFQEALRIRPGYREALNNLQVALAQQKNAR